MKTTLNATVNIQVATELDKFIGDGNRSKFVEDAVREKLEREEKALKKNKKP